MKRDGHTHTHFCPHASEQETEVYVLQAIREGFQMYSFTEHFLLPHNLYRVLPYPCEVKDSLQIDMDAYIREMQRLQKKYRDRIGLLVGLEVDYLPGYESETRYILKEYGPFLDDGLLSVHFIRGKEGLFMVDYSPADYERGLFPLYENYEQVQLAYYRTIKEALTADLGPHKPTRVAHLSLCNKYQQIFNPENNPASPDLVREVSGLLDYMALQGYSLDINTAGLFKGKCGEIYPSPWIVSIARKLGIPMVYGSDAHDPQEVGRGYEAYQALVG